MPYGTFAVNVVGSFLIGLIMAAALSRGSLDSRLRLAATIGFLGGFTTYSAFAFESLSLLEQRSAMWATLYVGLTLVAATLGCYAGMVVGKRI